MSNATQTTYRLTATRDPHSRNPQGSWYWSLDRERGEDQPIRHDPNDTIAEGCALTRDAAYRQGERAAFAHGLVQQSGDAANGYIFAPAGGAA